MNLQQIFIALFIICFIQATYVDSSCCERRYGKSETYRTCCNQIKDPNSSLLCKDFGFADDSTAKETSDDDEEVVFETFGKLLEKRCELKKMSCESTTLPNNNGFKTTNRTVDCAVKKGSCQGNKCWRNPRSLTGKPSGKSNDTPTHKFINLKKSSGKSTGTVASTPPQSSGGSNGTVIPTPTRNPPTPSNIIDAQRTSQREPSEKNMGEPPQTPETPQIPNFERFFHSIVLSQGTYISKRLSRTFRQGGFILKRLRNYQLRFKRMKVYLELGENDKCKEWINTTTEAFDEYFTNQSSDSSNLDVSIEDALTFFADMTSDFVEPNTCNSSLIKKVLQSLVLSIVDLSEKNTDNLKQITGDTINVNSNHEKQGNIKVIHITMNMNNVSLNFTKANTTCNTTYLLISDIKTIKVVANGTNGSNVNASIIFKIKDEHKRMGAECFFWNETKIEWSKTGVKTAEMNNNLVKCISDHLTSFAIFVSNSEFPRTDIHSTALNILSLIGCGLSLSGVVLTLMVYAFFSKTVTLLRTLHYKAHINLLLSLGLMQTAFIVGINIANYKIGCKIAAVMLHYFSLTSFCWMGVEGVILYLKIIKVFNSEVVTVKLFCLFTWGIPMVFVGTVASFYFDDYGSNNVCWLTFQGYLVIWAFVAPSGLIVLMNMIVLCLVLRVAIKTNESGKAKDRIKSALKPVCILSPILGVTWLFGILAFTHESVVWQYAFAICNSLQGFVIFVIYGLAKKELRDAIIRKFFNLAQINDHSTHTSNKIDGF